MAYDVITPKKILNTELPTVNEVLYTVPENTIVIIKDINICNSFASSADISIYLVNADDSYDAKNALIFDSTINASDSFRWSGTQVLEAGDTIEGVSSVADVCIKISGGLAV